LQERLVAGARDWPGHRQCLNYLNNPDGIQGHNFSTQVAHVDERRVLQGRLTLVRYNNEPQFFLADASVFFGLVVDILERLGPYLEPDASMQRQSAGCARSWRWSNADRQPRLGRSRPAETEPGRQAGPGLDAGSAHEPRFSPRPISASPAEAAWRGHRSRLALMACRCANVTGWATVNGKSRCGSGRGAAPRLQ